MIFFCQDRQDQATNSDIVDIMFLFPFGCCTCHRLEQFSLRSFQIFLDKGCTAIYNLSLRSFHAEPVPDSRHIFKFRFHLGQYWLKILRKSCVPSSFVYQSNRSLVYLSYAHIIMYIYIYIHMIYVYEYTICVIWHVMTWHYLILYATSWYDMTWIQYVYVCIYIYIYIQEYM